MGLELHPFDRDVIKTLRSAGVLRNYSARGKNGQIVVACSDGDQMKDLLLHKWQAAIASGKIFRPHMLCIHGGAMNIDPECTLYPGLNEVLVKHIEQAEEPDLKGITCVNLSIHTPCGAAKLAEQTLIHQLWSLFRAVREVELIDPTDSILPTFQVDYGPDVRLMNKAGSSEYARSVQSVQSLADELGVNILIPLLDTHRRRTYQVDLVAFVTFWISSGRELWGHLFENDPCPVSDVDTLNLKCVHFFSRDVIEERT